MGRRRSRSRSYSPRRISRSGTPPRRKRYDDPRDRRRRDRRSPASSGLLVRNISLDTRPEDLRIPFEKFGPVKDVYLPRNYYTGEPRGFGFVKFRYPEDAAQAKDRLNYTIIGGREIRIVFAEENRKTPHEMRRIARTSGTSGGRRRSPPRSPRSRYRSFSRSPSPGARHSRSVSRSRSSGSERDYRSSQRSLSPRERSPSDERAFRKRDGSRYPRETSTHDEKEYKSSRRSYSPREVSPDGGKYRSSRRSPSSREISPHDGKDLASPGRSVSPRKKSSTVDGKSKQRASSSREDSPQYEDYRSNEKPVSPRDLSSVDERGDMSKCRSLSPRKNRGSPVRTNLASGKSRSPRRTARRISCSQSRSRSYSPR